MISRILYTVRLLERGLAIALLAALVAVVFAGAVGRYSGRPVLWSDEVAQVLFVWVAMLAADLTLQRSGHFSVDIFANMLPLKARLALDILIYLLIAILLGLLLVNGFRFAEMTSGRPLPMIRMPASLATAALPVGFGLMLITLAEQVIRRLRHFREPPPAHMTSEVM